MSKSEPATETATGPLCGDSARYDRGECNWPKCGCQVKDEAPTQTAPCAFAVHWRSRDGLGTHVWKDGLTEAEADAQIVWCEGHHPEATLVWSVQAGANQTRALRVKEEAHD